MMIFSDIGLGSLITREISQKKEGYLEYVSTAIFLRNAVLLISTILVFIVSPYISHIEEAKTLFPLIAMIFFFDSLRELLIAINRASEKMEREMIVKTVMGLATFVSGIILLKIKVAPISMGIAYVIGSGLSFLIMALIIKKDLKKYFFKIQKKYLKPVIKITLPFATMAIITTIMGNTDIFMLGIWKNPTEIGLYTSAQRIQQLIVIVPSMLATAIFPIMSQLAKDNNELFKKMLEKILAFLILIGMPIAFGGVILSGQLISLFFGAGYSGGVTTMRILMLALLAYFPLYVLYNSVFAYNKQKELMIAYASGLVANIILNFLLIQKFGAVGAAVASLVSNLLITSIIWQKMKKINYFEILSKLNKVFFATFFMLIIMLLAKYSGITVLYNILISSVIYLGSLLLLRESILKEIRSVIKI